MSGVQDFLHGRQQAQPDPRRQALGNQLKVTVPPTKLRSVEPRPVTPQSSHGDRPYTQEVRRPDSRLPKTSNGKDGMFDTDTENLDDTTVTSVGNSSSNHELGKQVANHMSYGEKTGAGNSIASRPSLPFEGVYVQRQSGQRLDQLDNEDLAIEVDGGSFEGSEDDETEGSGEEGEEYGSTEEDDAHEYPDPGGHPDYQQLDYQQIAESPTMKYIRSGGGISQRPNNAFSSQMNSPMERARQLGIGSSIPDQTTSHNFPKLAPAARFQTDPRRSNKQLVTQGQYPAPNRQIVNSDQQARKQDFCTPPSTSSKHATPELKLRERSRENQILTVMESEIPSLPVTTKDLHVRTKHGIRNGNGLLPTADANHDLMPPPGHSKASSAPDSPIDRKANALQQDIDEIELVSLNDPLAGLGGGDESTHEDRSVDDEGSTLSLEAMPDRKHARDLDYGADQLSAMTFEQLSSEPFTYDPKRKPLSPEEAASGTLAEKLDEMLKEGDVSTKESKRQAIISSLPIEQYRECGDLIVGKFGKIITKFADARQKRRDIIMQFEAEVAKRESRVRSKTGAVEKDLGRLKRRGEDAINGNMDE